MYISQDLAITTLHCCDCNCITVLDMLITVVLILVHGSLSLAGVSSCDGDFLYLLVRYFFRLFVSSQLFPFLYEF